MTDFVFLFILFLVVVAGVVAFIFLKRKFKVDQGQTEAIRDLERRLTDLMVAQLKEIRGNVDNTSQAMHKQISSFTAETVRIREDLKQVREEMKGISSFQEFFRSPKLRGEWGEASLEHVLAEYFPREFYTMQHLFSSGEQVDAVLKLPNGKFLPIDAKFPFDNFRKMVEAGSSEEKAGFRKKFTEDAKLRIQEIASKYILPSENTVDFALMYIPAEAVYYEINMGREIDLASYAQSKKVILTSPNTIYLTLRTIEHWFRDTQISRQTQEILKRLSRIQQDAGKLREGFRRLGGHLKNASSAYESSEKRLSLFSERVGQLTKLEQPKQLKEPPSKEE